MHKRLDRLVLAHAIKDSVLFVEEFAEAFDPSETDWDEACVDEIKEKAKSLSVYNEDDDDVEIGERYREYLEEFTQALAEAVNLELL